VILGYLGPEYTFSHKAALRYLQTKQNLTLNLTRTPSISFDALFDRLMHHSQSRDLLPEPQNQIHTDYYDKIIIPLENSIAGAINENIDLLKNAIKPSSLKEWETLYKNQNTKSFIVPENEIVLPVEHNLMNCDKAQMIQLILSHPQPIAQCKNYLNKNYPKALILEVNSTTFAAQMALSLTPEATEIRQKRLQQAGIFDPNPGIAVIGDSNLIQLAPDRLQIIDSPINDHPNNMTRFLILGTELQPVTRHDKTSIVVSAQQDQPGGLYQILGEFACRNINLTKIESKPTKEVLGEYLFYIDFTGHMSQSHITEALSAVEKSASYFKILGSYSII